MTFADAVNNLREGYAAKRSSWNGFVVKTDVVTPDEGPETYKLKFYKIATEPMADPTVVTSDDPAVYTWDGSKFTHTGTLAMDDELMAAMIADDWITGVATDFEAVRKPDPSKVW